MKFYWLGQGGLYFTCPQIRIMIDPYLSDSLYLKCGDRNKRLFPADESFLKVPCDLLILTHGHEDHTDLPSIRAILSHNDRVTVLASRTAYELLRPEFGERHRLVQFGGSAEWTEADAVCRAVPAIHSDPTAFGVLLEADGLCVYVTGDTLYTRDILSGIDRRVDVMFTVMNGWGNNMNIADAARLTEQIRPEIVFPIHWGLFERFTADPELFIERFRNSSITAYKPDVYQCFDLTSAVQRSRSAE